MQVSNFESNCLLAVQEVNKEAGSFSEWRNIILNIIYFKTLRGIVYFPHISRVANELAYFLAKAHGLQDDFQIWYFSNA